MDEFRELAWEALGPELFDRGNDVCFGFFIPQLASALQGEAENRDGLKWSPLGREEMVEFFSSDNHGLRLLYIQTNERGSLMIDKEVFELLWRLESPGFDDASLWLIAHKYDGYHYFRGPNQIDTFFFGFPLFAVVWTFNHRTLSTAALIIDRTFYRASGGRAARRLHVPLAGIDMPSRAYFISSNFTASLKKHASYTSASGFMGYVIALVICIRYDAFDSESDLSQIREIEESTGFRLAGIPRRDGFDIERLTQWLQTSGQILITISARKRTLRSVASMLDHVTTQMDEMGSSHLDGDLQSRAAESSRHLAEAMPSMKSRIHAYQEYMDYMNVRVERLSNVLFTLLTHKDAETSIEQAHASRELAEAAKRDSSAMKTIAVMTMAFLPATFFAALFAIPSLDWKSDTVIQGNHWIYWAFTAPATVLVFLIWFLLNNRHWMTRQYVRRSQDIKEKKSRKVFRAIRHRKGGSDTVNDAA